MKDASLIHSPTVAILSNKAIWSDLPPWAVISLQVVVTAPLYVFAFWLMIEGIKSGGEPLIEVIDYLAFK